jgi:sugar phosphate isomerase/epimerase
MKIGCIPLCFGREIRRDRTMSLEDWIRMAVELCLDGTEIYEPFISDLDEAAMARLAGFVHDSGLQVSMLTPETDFSSPEKREEAIAQVKRFVDMAVVLKTNVVRLTAASHGLVDRVTAIRLLVGGAAKEDVLRSCADGMRACLDYAEEKGVMLALEDHPVIGTNVEDFMRVLELVDDDRLKVNLDTANVPRDSTAELARRLGARVVHTHISELLEGRHGIVIGKGDVDFRGVFRALKESGYDGWLSLEALTGGKEDLRYSIGHIRKAWNEA